MDYAPVTTIFGPQSSGKSTLLKILNYCAWLEKQVMLPKSDVDNVVYNYTHYHHFRNFLCQFFRFDKKMFSSESLIHYTGECVEIIMEGRKNASIRLMPEFKENRFNTKLAFIPAERNIVSIIRNYDRLIRANQIDSLINYILEWQEARVKFKATNALPLAADADID